MKQEAGRILLDNLKENLDEIRERMHDAAARAGRDAAQVKLIAVTKTVPADVINAAIALGVTDIGENRAQEWQNKEEFVNIPRNNIHFIGQIQTNKLRLITKLTNIIHSLDKLAAAEEISRLCEGEDQRRKVLVQVNIGREPQKGGVLEEELPALLEGVSKLGKVEVIGLMCIPPYGEPARRYFAAMRGVAQRMDGLGLPNVSMKELSMGMSSDYDEAILEGATMVRVGSALFGGRN